MSQGADIVTPCGYELMSVYCIASFLICEGRLGGVAAGATEFTFIVIFRYHGS